MTFTSKNYWGVNLLTYLLTYLLLIALLAYTTNERTNRLDGIPPMTQPHGNDHWHLQIIRRTHAFLTGYLQVCVRPIRYDVILMIFRFPVCQRSPEIHEMLITFRWLALCSWTTIGEAPKPLAQPRGTRHVDGSGTNSILIRSRIIIQRSERTSH